MRSIWRLIVACCAIAVMTSFACAEEVIYNFNSDVTLSTNGNVDVVESIEVRAEGVNIKRGIYRDIPTLLVNPDGSKLRSNLSVISVERDGRAEPYFTESITNGLRIYIGQSDVFLRTGTYRYTIHYTMTRMARYFTDYDELFWNATGNFWDFPILNATSRVFLPTGARIENMSVYTGAFGDTKGAASVAKQADNIAVFKLSEPLGRYEGMSVAVSFQKGILAEPAGGEKFLNTLSDYRDVILPGVAVFLIILYYLFAWDSVGRDPKKGTIIPLFHPPANTSPALAHYIWAMGWKKAGWQAFTAAMISLGVQGLIKIDKDGKKTRLTKVQGQTWPKLPAGEAVVYNYISSRGSVTIDKTTGPSLNTKRGEFVSALETENRYAYFKNNYVYVIVGVVLSFVCLLVLVATGTLAIEWMFLALFGGIFLGVTLTALKSMWSAGGLIRYFQLAMLGFFASNFLIGARGALSILDGFSLGAPVIAAASIIAINFIFAVLMRAPTAQGRKIMDQIEGFRMYMDTAEKERLNMVGEPEMTVKRFEAILPYAIALGVEKPWTEHFEGELSRHAVVDAGATYTPGWYHDPNFSSSSLSRDMSSLASGMSAAMIAAQPASSSSSGSSGGGSSGGGGGGGGGGGW